MFSGIIEYLYLIAASFTGVALLVILFVDSIPILNKYISFVKPTSVILLFLFGFSVFQYGKTVEAKDLDEKTHQVQTEVQDKEEKAKIVTKYIDREVIVRVKDNKANESVGINTITKDSQELNTNCKIPTTTIKALNDAIK
jgi:hypothetical protein